ncbi:hypothetical protein AY601_4100 [Pedobacter cryoconitis]|uniref:Uncharacterized protein n=1 Tax=Pedobacter cryoconitis TaxID=188932 RepID=A0A127VIC9_9SPHI|nr:hypothetical protein [Pedobacter cryoconitis]AMQ00951.1 hypothetical protein AY601_4100 [Pedobacter cryoconitis]
MENGQLESESKERNRILKNFLEEFFDFYTLRKVGFFPKEMKKTDIHGQAKRICEWFSFKTVFEYGVSKIRCHISYADGYRPQHVDVDGELQHEPFITEIGGIYE